jgi:putative glycosyltransferase (TIGR04372 family)
MCRIKQKAELKSGSRAGQLSKWIKQIIHLVGSQILYLFLILLERFVKVKILRLHSARIGHLIFNFENFYYNYYIENKGIRHLYIVILDKKVSNIKILSLIKKKVRGLYFKGAFVYIFESITNKKTRDRFFIPWSTMHPYKTSINTKPSLITRNDLKNLESPINLQLEKKSYVVFHARNDLYLQKFELEDGNDHTYRNFNFSSFNRSINYLGVRNIASVRIGHYQANEQYEENCLDYANSNFEDELKLISNSKFFVSGNSGISHISTLLRKPHLYVNFIPLRLDNLSACAPNSIVVPKHIFKNNSDRLNLNNLFGISENWSIHDKDYIKKQNLRILDNTDYEILMGVEQMLEFQETHESNLNYENIKESYGKIIEATNDKEFAKYIFFELKIRFSNVFLKHYL